MTVMSVLEIPILTSRPETPMHKEKTKRVLLTRTILLRNNFRKAYEKRKSKKTVLAQWIKDTWNRKHVMPTPIVSWYYQRQRYYILGYVIFKNYIAKMRTGRYSLQLVCNCLSHNFLHSLHVLRLISAKYTYLVSPLTLLAPGRSNMSA